jgi:hypothetical protein
MFQQCFVIVVKKPVAAELHNLKLPLEIFGGNPLAEMFLPISCQMHKISHHASYLDIVADARLPAVAVVIQIQIQSRGYPRPAENPAPTT